MSGVGGGGLDAALKVLAKHTEIHGSLQAGFLKLYGYTSDAKGIRHPWKNPIRSDLMEPSSC